MNEATEGLITLLSLIGITTGFFFTIVFLLVTDKGHHE